MKLPNDSIGISDLLDWRECPQRMAHGMRRHVTLPSGKKDEPPGHRNWTNAYGSAIHDAIHLVETLGLTNEEAVDRVWPEYGGFLNPEELAMLKEDMDAYRGDTPLGMELVAAEVDARVPLFVHEGRQVYFRFKIDALYRRTDDPTVFYQRDYKSSKHRKTQADVDSDLQMWAYNFGICELYPEAQSLLQSYEQLRFGNHLTSKNAGQRAQMKEWLQRTALAVLEDDTLEPKQNDWCPWCPLVVECDQTKRSTRYWKGRLAILAPLTKEGRRTKVAFADEGADLEEMMRDVLPPMIRSRKHMETVEKALKGLIEEMTVEQREELGWRLSDRKAKVLSPDGLRALHEIMGDSFYEAISVSRSALETVAGKDSPAVETMRSVELEKVSSTALVPTDNH